MFLAFGIILCMADKFEKEIIRSLKKLEKINVEGFEKLEKTLAACKNLLSEMNPRRFFTIQEIAKMLGISRKSVYTLVKQKKLRVVKIGKGTLRVSEQELNRFLRDKAK